MIVRNPLWQKNLGSTTGEKVKIKVWTLSYSATYMSQTRNQQRFTISEVAADWHELINGAAAHYVAINCPR